jgi:hypothetical protein
MTRERWMLWMLVGLSAILGTLLFFSVSSMAPRRFFFACMRTSVVI